MDAFQGPWPGARPLNEQDAEVYFLAGRDDDIARFAEGVDHHELTHLTGETGVGKTSLLYAGIIPHFRKRGYTIATCRDWNNQAAGHVDSDAESSPSADDFDIFLARALYKSLPAEVRNQFSANTDIFYELAELRGSAFIVLDQFEELLRRDRSAHQQVFGFIQFLINQLGLVVVLSYRSEYKYLMQPLDQKVEHRKYINLEPISDEAVKDVVTNPRRPVEADDRWSWEEILEPQACEEVETLVLNARGVSTGSYSGIGLLHVQALLFVLWMRATAEAAEAAGDGQAPRITTGTVAGFRLAAERAGHKSDDGQLSFALEESATIRLDQAVSAARSASVGMDEYLIRGVAETVARIVPHLSSGGYKLARKATDLVSTLLSSDVTATRKLLRAADGQNPDGHMDDILVAFTSTTAASGQSVLTTPRSELGHRLGATWADLFSQDDGAGTAAGPVLGLGTPTAMVERLRRFGWALVWLDQLNLARLSPDPKSGAWVELVHDGFGEPLERWSRDFLEAHGTWGLYALTTPEGEVHDWSAGYEDELHGTPDRPKIWVNLGFKGNGVIGADLRHVVFANCDFRGTLFQYCSFEAVTFLNCQLDGALFSDCAVAGKSQDTAKVASGADRDYAAPTFVLRDASEALTTTLARYREIPGAALALFSGVPGEPALPEPEHPAREWSGPTGGLRLQGSQVSALTFRGTAFQEDGVLEFVEVRGAGVDLAELTLQHPHPTKKLKPISTSGAKIRFRSSALRHVSFTAHNAPENEQQLDVDVDSCAVAQWWVGGGFAGELTVKNSLAAQIWVDSTGEEGFSASCEHTSPAIGLVDIKPAPGVLRLGRPDLVEGTPVAQDEVVERLRTRTDLMEYRRSGA